MTTQQDTHRPLQPPTPQPVQHDDHTSGGAGAFIVMLLGLLAWGLAFASWSTAEDADVPTSNYFLAVCLTIVGATFLLVAAIYDATRRDR